MVPAIAAGADAGILRIRRLIELGLSPSQIRAEGNVSPEGLREVDPSPPARPVMRPAAGEYGESSPAPVDPVDEITDGGDEGGRGFLGDEVADVRDRDRGDVVGDLAHRLLGEGGVDAVDGEDGDGQRL
jgi:hypothetical protein